MSVFELSVPGDPLSKARPRVFHGHGITDQRTKNAENRVYSEFRRKYGDVKPIEGPVQVGIKFFMASRHPRDWDNLAKLVTDALNGVAYRDDVQIVEARVSKVLPDQMVPGVRKGTKRKRKTGDPLLHHGRPYEPHTFILISELMETD